MDPGQLAAGSHPGHRTQLFAGIGGQEEDTLVDPVAIESDPSTIALKRARGLDPRLPAKVEPGSLHREPFEHRLHLGGKLDAGGASCRIQDFSGGGVVGQSVVGRTPEPGRARSSTDSSSCRSPGESVAMSEDLRQRFSILQHQLIEEVETGLDVFELVGIAVGGFLQTLNLPNDIFDL